MHLRHITFLVFAALLTPSAILATPLSYQVVVNTSSLAGTKGFLDLQLNPGSAADAVGATVTAFSTSGSLYSAPLNGNSGSASGTLPGTLVLTNSAAFNDVFQGIMFGNSIQFDVSFSGTAFTNPSGTISGSAFSIGLYDAAASNPLLTNDSSGALALANIGPFGSFSFTGLPDATGGTSVATIKPLETTSPVPEPASFVLILTGCSLLWWLRARNGFSRGSIVSALAIGMAATASADAQQVVRFATPPTSNTKANFALTPNATSPACPNQGGLLAVISVPVANTVTLVLYLGRPSPISTTFQISSTNTAIVGGSQNQGFIPQVAVQAGDIYSSPFNLYGQAIGQSNVIATDLSGYYGQSSTPVTSWDLNAGDSKYKLLDANPANNSCVDPSSGAVTNNLATCGSSAKGVATDGVTNLLMRLTTALPGTACYAITSTSSLDQGQVQTAVNTTQSGAGLQQAYSLYTAPQNYGDASDSRTVQFTFSYTPLQSLGNGNTSSFTANLTVVRPPVILIHGVWSSADTWPDFFLKNDSSHWTFPADYTSTNASSFSVNSPSVKMWVAQGLNKARTSGIAVTQADVIAHSMGGILTRLYASSNQFLRADNLKKGDVHRLVTLDTPHMGATFANLIVGLHNAVPAATEATALSITGGNITKGAVCDLSENSAALTGLNAATMLTGTVDTATGGPAGSQAVPAKYWSTGSFESSLTAKKCLNRVLGYCAQYGDYIFPQSTVDGFRFRQANDTIVGLASQQGGITSGTNYPNLVHAGFRRFGITFVASINNSSDVATQVYNLLDQSNSSFVTSFPGVNSTGNGLPVTVPGRGNGSDVTDWAAQCTAGKPMKPAGTLTSTQDATDSSSQALVPAKAIINPSAASPLVQLVSPLAGQSFTTLQTVLVTVQVDPRLNATDGFLFTTGLDEYQPTTFSPTGFTVSVPLPSYFTGSVDLTPAVSDANGNLTFGAPVTIGVAPSSPPVSVALVEHNYYLAPTDGSQELHLVGTFSDKSQLDLTGAATGTTYISSDPNVLTVDSEGNFTVVASGIAFVTASNTGLSDSAVFVIEDPHSPLAPLTFTNQTAITMSGFTLNRQTGFFVGSMTIAVPANVAIPGPLVVLLNGLTKGVSLVNGNGLTVQNSPGTPYISLTLPGQGLIFRAGQTITIPLQFLNPGRALISTTPSVIRTSAAP